MLRIFVYFQGFAKAKAQMDIFSDIPITLAQVEERGGWIIESILAEKCLNIWPFGDLVHCDSFTRANKE